MPKVKEKNSEPDKKDIIIQDLNFALTAMRDMINQGKETEVQLRVALFKEMKKNELLTKAKVSSGVTV